eukprot:517911-Pleurochrysis_carterae.AAC.1
MLNGRFDACLTPYSIPYALLYVMTWRSSGDFCTQHCSVIKTGMILSERFELAFRRQQVRMAPTPFFPWQFICALSSPDVEISYCRDMRSDVEH